ncbi:MaoC/PaaZ C-terminal domain-containing protein [Sphingomonas sp. 28-63-12]|uniref:MaoC/PaaZ C-terminal domain-containing protein n=1 Tax=Sphingomonas sp. 28-63-12 TaxID=1970434 RepID=UPI000BC3B2A4|nr:MAG: dehydratase [Sphingomonas sp. 28-63-12]
MIRPPRTFEDLALGERRRSSTRSITEGEIIAFARLYDPQWFHSDAEAARESHFGEVIASGVQVLAIWRQLDHEINGDIDFVCGVGFDDMRLKNALRPGDTVYVTSKITSLEPSHSGKPRGTAMTLYEMINQKGETVVSFTSINLVYTAAARAVS